MIATGFPILPRTPAPEGQRRLRVLVADDSPLCQLEVQLLLLELDVDVELAADGSEAVSRFQTGCFDLVLMDIEMPVMDGLSAIWAIRALERHRGQPPARIVILSGRLDDQCRRTAQDSGVHLFLTKPVDPEAIQALVADLAAQEP